LKPPCCLKTLVFRAMIRLSSLLMFFQTVDAKRLSEHGNAMAMQKDATRSEVQLPTVEDKFSCKAGQGEAFQSFEMTGDNSKEACAALCDKNQSKCVGFDFTEKNSSHVQLWPLPSDFTKKDSCRLYKNNKPRFGEFESGPAGRQYCERTVLGKFACVMGKGAPISTYKETSETSSVACATLCDDDEECASFDFTPSPSSHPVMFDVHPHWEKDSCRLYKVITEKRDSAERQYCKKISAQATIAEEDTITEEVIENVHGSGPDVEAAIAEEQVEEKEEQDDEEEEQTDEEQGEEEEKLYMPLSRPQ